MSIEDLTILTQRVVSSNNESSDTVKITGDADTDKKIQEYFNKHKKNDKASNPTDTLSEVYAEYDKNHNGKLDRSERKAAGMTRSEARAFNRAMKAFGGDDGEIESYALNDNSGTMYTKDGKFLFSIQNQNGDTVTTLYKDNKPESRTTENQNYTKTEENFNADEKALTTTYKYTESYSASNNGLTQETTIIADDGKVTTTKDYTGRQDVITKEVIVQNNADATERTVTTYKGANDATSTTKTQIKNANGEWTDKPAEEPEPVTVAPEPKEEPEEKTEQDTALAALKEGFTKGNNISVTIQGGQTKLSSGDYQGTINLPAGETFKEGERPQILYMSLPDGIGGKMKLTYDEKTGLYTTTRGDRQFKITADNGKITMEAVTDNPEVQQKLSRNLDESKTKIDLSKSSNAQSPSIENPSPQHDDWETKGNWVYTKITFAKGISAEDIAKTIYTYEGIKNPSEQDVERRATAIKNAYKEHFTDGKMNKNIELDYRISAHDAQGKVVARGQNGYYVVQDEKGKLIYKNYKRKTITEQEFSEKCPNITAQLNEVKKSKKDAIIEDIKVNVLSNQTVKYYKADENLKDTYVDSVASGIIDKDVQEYFDKANNVLADAASGAEIEETWTFDGGKHLKLSDGKWIEVFYNDKGDEITKIRVTFEPKEDYEWPDKSFDGNEVVYTEVSSKAFLAHKDGELNYEITAGYDFEKIKNIVESIFSKQPEN